MGLAEAARVELVAPIANMLEAALAAGPPTDPASPSQASPSHKGGAVHAGPRQDHPVPPGPHSVDLRSPVDSGSGAQQHRVHLGLSGRSAQGRAGFKEVVGRVCLGEVGAIFGLEVSRLARSSADLSKLLELARLTNTLVIDADGVYDLSDFNDRMLLGLKSTMSEAELHILASRMDQAKRAAAARGELRLALPAGYVHDDQGQVVIDPDQEVQAAVADLFALFRATGSAYGVVGAFTGRRFPRRAHGGSWTGELAWAPLTHDRVLKVLANPVYAGAYVFGRHRLQRVVTPDGSVVTRRVDQPRAQWETLLLGHHAGYIS